MKVASLPQLPGFTVIPGVEWTHYRGHNNFLGLEQPYDEPFFTNDEAEVQKRFQDAHERGALIVLNHIQDDDLPFTFNTDALPYDLLEVWNGPMRLSILRAVVAWQARFVGGQKVPMICGSDYHKGALFQILGGPSLLVFAQSEFTTDILEAVSQGRSYTVYEADGPKLEMRCEDTLLGGLLSWRVELKLSLSLESLQTGDELRLVGKPTSQTFFKALNPGTLQMEAPVGEAASRAWNSGARFTPAYRVYHFSSPTRFGSIELIFEL